MPFFRDFFDDFFLKNGGGSLGFLYFQKCVFLALKTTFSAKKDKKVSTIVDFEDSIIQTFRYCENVRDLGFREYRRSIFSGLL